MAEKPYVSDVEARLCNMARGIIEEAIQYNWLHRTAKPDIDVHLSEETGATDAIILQADVRVKLFVKFHTTDATREENGYEVLKGGPEEFTRHLVPPLPLESRSPLWLTPLVNATPLHNLVARPKVVPLFEQGIKELYEDFLGAMKALWLHTQMSTPPNFGQIYVNRIWDRIDLMEQGFNTSNFKDLVIEVNGVNYGIFEELMTDFEERINRANAGVHSSCIIHGDEHAKNIMVYNSIGRDPTGWVIVDYVNVRKEADWIFSVAKMLHWWQFYSALELAKKDSGLQQALRAEYNPDALKQNRLIITYDDNVLQEQVPLRCRYLQQWVLDFTQEVAEVFGENPQDCRQRLELALFSVIFASAPLHFRRAAFAVPIMIGESLKHLQSSF